MRRVEAQDAQFVRVLCEKVLEDAETQRINVAVDTLTDRVFSLLSVQDEGNFSLSEKKIESLCSDFFEKWNVPDRLWRVD